MKIATTTTTTTTATTTTPTTRRPTLSSTLVLFRPSTYNLLRPTKPTAAPSVVANQSKLRGRAESCAHAHLCANSRTSSAKIKPVASQQQVNNRCCTARTSQFTRHRCQGYLYGTAHVVSSPSSVDFTIRCSRNFSTINLTNAPKK